MAARYSIELDLNTKGYTDGVNEGKDSNAEFESSMKRVTKEIDPMRQELKRAKKYAQDLALAFHRLSDEEKKSGVGEALKKELDKAKESAAEMVDLADDLEKEIKNMASDTANWDAFKEGINVGKDAMTALVTVTQDLTGKNEDLAKMIQTIARVQSIANAMITIGNAVQKQSALMTGIARVQKWALKKAIDAETVATGRATVAQTAFNAVAKANPYVLLASAVLAVGAALAAFTLSSKESKEETKELNKEQTQFQKSLEDINRSAAGTYASTLSGLMVKYIGLRNSYRKLTTEHEKLDWIKKYKDALKDIGLEVNNVSDAERILINDTNNVKQAFIERAKAAAQYAKLQDLMTKKYEAEYEARKKAVQFKEGETVQGSDVERYGLIEGVDFERGKNEIGSGRYTEAGAVKATLAAQQKSVATAVKDYQQEIDDLVDNIVDSNIKITEAGNKSLNNNHTNNKTELKDAIGSINDLQKKITDLQARAKAGLLPDADEYKKELKRLTDEKYELEVQWGFAQPKSKLDKLQEKLDGAKLAYTFAVDSDDESARKAAQEAYYSVQSEIDKYKASIEIEPKVDLTKLEQQRKEIQDIVKEALESGNIEVPYDFSSLPESVQQEAEGVLEQFNTIKEAKERLTDIMNNADASDAQISAAQDGLEELGTVYDSLKEKLDTWDEANDILDEQNAKIQKQTELYQTAGQMIGNMGSALSSLGQAFGSQELQAAGIVANAIATIIQGYATATAQAATMGPWAWVGFAVAGLAQVASMISQIKNLTAGSYAGGGIIGGSSYYGDHLVANVNSGEMIFNKKQQKQLFKLANSNIKSNNTQSIAIESIGVRGEDIILAARNTLKITGETL